MKKIIYIFTAAIFTIAISAASVYSFDSAYAKVLQSKIVQLKNTYSLVGISAAALVPNQGIWTGTAGISSQDSDAVTAEMVFGAGSITKNFIASIILQLDEDDSLSINDSLGKWIPHYNNINSSATIKQLLGHTSGIYNVTDNPNFIAAINSNLNRRWTIEEVLTGGYVLNPYFTPGAGFHYSNTGYMILGIIIEKILRTNLAQIFRERFFNQFYLTGSFFEIDDTITAPFAHNWADITGTGIIQDAFFIPTMALNSSTIGAGGVISRPDNLVRWLDLLYNSSFVLDSVSKSQMLTFRSANISGATGYGLGTMRYPLTGRFGYGHGGNTFGYTSVMIYDPVDKISIAIMMNRDLNGGPPGIAFMNTVIQNNPVGIKSEISSIPQHYHLYQNYPNPFNPSTKIKFELPEKEFVSLKILNLLGQEITTLHNGVLSSGIHSIEWNAAGYTSGVYFYKLTTNNFSQTKSMALVK